VQQFPKSIERLLTLAKGEVGEDAGGCCMLAAMLQGGYQHCWCGCWRCFCDGSIVQAS
jgi:hypothetical protein